MGQRVKASDVVYWVEGEMPFDDSKIQRGTCVNGHQGTMCMNV